MKMKLCNGLAGGVDIHAPYYMLEFDNNKRLEIHTSAGNIVIVIGYDPTHEFFALGEIDHCPGSAPLRGFPRVNLNMPEAARPTEAATRPTTGVIPHR